MKGHQMGATVAILLTLVCVSVYGRPEPEGDEDPFEEDPDPDQEPNGAGEDGNGRCIIEVDRETLRAVTGTVRPCDGPIWPHLLAQFHRLRNNLSECQSREQLVSSPDIPYTDCEQRLDDTERQLRQERHRQVTELERQLQAVRGTVRTEEERVRALVAANGQATDERDALVAELVVTNIGVGDTRQALKYYHRLPGGRRSGSLHDAVLQSVYRRAPFQDRQLENLLAFVRQLGDGDAGAKMQLYRRINAELMKRPRQRDSFLAAIAALDLIGLTVPGPDGGGLPGDRHLYADTITPVSEHWQRQIAAGNFTDVVHFATNYPAYFDHLQDILVPVDPAVWQPNFGRIVQYPNHLPQPQHRLMALGKILTQIQRNRGAKETGGFLRLAALEVDVCEQFIKAGRYDQSVQRRLTNVKNQFGAIDRTKDYAFYLKEAKQNTQNG